MSDDVGWRYSIEVQANVDASAGDLGEVAYRWMDDMSAALAPDLRAELADAPARIAPTSGPERPGTVVGTVDFQHFDADGGNRRLGERTASTAGLQWLQQKLAGQCRFASLGLSRVPGRAGEWVILKTKFLPESPGWLRVCAYLAEERFTDPVEGAGMQRRYLQALWSFVDELNPGFGHIAYRMGDGGPTAYEKCLRNIVTPNPFQWWLDSYTVGNCREFLRGYSWLTIVPAEIAARLGGIETLAGSGAFVEVRPFAEGGVWLLATEDWRDYTNEAIRRVYDVVAPALRPGRLTNWPREHGEAPFQLVLDDAIELPPPPAMTPPAFPTP